MMNHQLFREHASLLLDNDLPDREQQELFRHLAECAECRSFHREMTLLRDAMRRRVPEEFPQRLDRRFGILGMELLAPVPVLSRSAGWLMPVGVALFMALGIYIIGMTQQEHQLQQYRRSMPVSFTSAADHPGSSIH